MPKRNRPYIALRSKEDPSTVYMTSKNPKNTTERLSLKKYSTRLRKHITFTESKQLLKLFWCIKKVVTCDDFLLCF